jgi:hypothetical protein
MDRQHEIDNNKLKRKLNMLHNVISMKDVKIRRLENQVVQLEDALTSIFQFDDEPQKNRVV